MDLPLQSWINQLPGEIQGLFLYHQQVTGYPPDVILNQALLFHYPDIFRQLDLSLPFFLILSPPDNIILSELMDISQQTLHEIIGLPISEDNQITKFPSFKELFPILKKSIYFQDFPDSRKYSILLQKLILQYHMTIQPAEVKFQSKWFSILPVYFNSDNVKSILNCPKTTVFDFNRINYYVRLLIYNRFELLTSIM